MYKKLICYKHELNGCLINLKVNYSSDNIENQKFLQIFCFDPFIRKGNQSTEIYKNLIFIFDNSHLFFLFF